MNYKNEKYKITLPNPSLEKRGARGEFPSSFTNFGSNAVDKLFTEEDVNELVELTRKLVV